MRFFAWGAVGAAIYGVVRGMNNGNFKQLVKSLPKSVSATNLKQMVQPLAAGMTQPLAAGMTQPLAAGMTQPLATGMTTNSLTKNLTKKQGV